MINSILDLISARNINIEHMINKPRGGYAYTMIDLAEKVNGEIIQPDTENPDVLRVRVNMKQMPPSGKRRGLNIGLRLPA